MLVERLSGLNTFLVAHVDGADELFDVQIGKFSDLVPGFDMVAEEDCITCLDVVFLAIFIASVEEGYEIRRRRYPQMEEFYDLKVAQVLTLLDSLPDALRNHTHLHIQLQQFHKDLKKIILEHCASLVCADHDSLRKDLAALGCNNLQETEL